MVNYNCQRCGYTTINKTMFKRHLLRKNMCSPELKEINRYDLLKMNKFNKLARNYDNVNQCKPNVNLTVNPNLHICAHCGKEFKSRQGKYKHIKYYCKKNEDEDLKELVRLMNNQLIEKDKTMQNYVKEQEKNNKMIQKLTNKLQITNYNNQNNIIVNNNIRLLNYNDTDISHLTSIDYKEAINQVNNATLDLIKRIHFNPNKPENMNIYIPNIKDKYIVLFKENTWQIQTRNKEIDDLMEDKYLLLQEWYNTNMNKVSQDEYNILKKNFERFDENINDTKIRNIVKNEIIMFLYNKRNMVLKNSDEQDVILLE